MHLIENFNSHKFFNSRENIIPIAFSVISIIFVGYVFMVQCIYGAMYLWCNVFMVQCIYGAIYYYLIKDIF